MKNAKKKTTHIKADPCAESPLPAGMTHQDFLDIRNDLYVWLTASVAHLACVQSASSDQDAANKITNLITSGAHDVTIDAGDLLYFVQAIRGSALPPETKRATRAAFKLVARTLKNTPSLTSVKARTNGATNPWSSGSTHPEPGELDEVFIPNV